MDENSFKKRAKEFKATRDASTGQLNDIIRNEFRPFILQQSEKVESTGVTVSGTIDSIILPLEQLEQTRELGPTREDFAQLKAITTNLDAQFGSLKTQTAEFINFIKDETEILVAASLVKTIPNIEQRIERLEDDVERKRNWRVNGWLLTLTIISTAAAVWALFIR